MCFLVVVTACNNNSIPNTDEEEQFDYFFLNVTQNNPIDTLFEKSFNVGNETYTEIVNTYTLMWIEEFNYTKSKCNIFFTDADETSTLIEYLDAWDTNERAIWDFEKKTIFDESRYKFGTQTYDDEWKKVGDRYREKTLWLKYCYFVVETDLDPALYSDKLESIKFASDTATLLLSPENESQ